MNHKMLPGTQEEHDIPANRVAVVSLPPTVRMEVCSHNTGHVSLLVSFNYVGHNIRVLGVSLKMVLQFFLKWKKKCQNHVVLCGGLKPTSVNCLCKLTCPYIDFGISHDLYIVLKGAGRWRAA